MNDYNIGEMKRSLMKVETLLSDIYDYMEIPKKHCPICNSDIRLFTPFGEHMRPNAKCPVCGSLERIRAWWIYYKSINLLGGTHSHIRMLHFAPELPLFGAFSEDENIDYYPVDYNPDFPGIVKVVDITSIPYEDNFFDRIICNHVLEHIDKEKIAIKELQRVLKPNGIIYLSVPQSNHKLTLEKDEYSTPELHREFYGQSDHVRLYGLDFAERIRKQSNLNVEERLICKEFSEGDCKRYGLTKDEKIWICTKK